ncbi:MAG: BatA domain-containing protein, partial [Planctomycetota bacterium]
MFSWMLNPLMLGLGGLAIGVPILIHLLNRRRYKIVDWAAMDFLLEADKKNRRRVQLENFLILALRCLAMLLLGLLLARPFLPSAMTSLLGQKEQFERVVLLDDSLSQQVLVDNLP